MMTLVMKLLLYLVNYTDELSAIKRNLLSTDFKPARFLIYFNVVPNTHTHTHTLLYVMVIPIFRFWMFCLL